MCWGVSRVGKVGKHGLEWDKPGALRISAVSSVSLFSSVAQSCLTLQTHELQHTRHHQLAELTQTHVYSIGDAIQPSHPLSSPSPPAFNLSSIRVFSNELALCIRWTKYWSFSFSINPSSEYSGLISFKMDWFDLLAVQEASE